MLLFQTDSHLLASIWTMNILLTMMRILARSRGWKGQTEIMHDLPNRDQFFVLYINLLLNFKRNSIYEDDAFKQKLAYIADFLDMY